MSIYVYIYSFSPSHENIFSFAYSNISVCSSWIVTWCCAYYWGKISSLLFIFSMWGHLCWRNTAGLSLGYTYLSGEFGRRDSPLLLVAVNLSPFCREHTSSDPCIIGWFAEVQVCRWSALLVTGRVNVWSTVGAGLLLLLT